MISTLLKILSLYNFGFDVDWRQTDSFVFSPVIPGLCVLGHVLPQPEKSDNRAPSWAVSKGLIFMHQVLGAKQILVIFLKYRFKSQHAVNFQGGGGGGVSTSKFLQVLFFLVMDSRVLGFLFTGTPKCKMRESEFQGRHPNRRVWARPWASILPLVVLLYLGRTDRN